MIQRTDRQHRIDRAIARALENCGDYYLPEKILRDEVGMLVLPHPTTGELDASIRYMDTERRITGIITETGTKYKLSDAGRGWLAEQS